MRKFCRLMRAVSQYEWSVAARVRKTQMNAFRLLTCYVLIGLSSTTQAGEQSENPFGLIYIDGKKAGQIHYTVDYGKGGDVETLRTRASLSCSSTSDNARTGRCCMQSIQLDSHA